MEQTSRLHYPKVRINNFKDIIGGEISDQFHQLMVDVLQRNFHSVGMGDIIPTPSKNDAFIKYVLQKHFGENSQVAPEQFIEYTDISRTGAEDFLNVLKNCKKFRQRISGQTFELDPYVHCADAQKLADELGLKYDYEQIDPDHDWRLDKVLFFEETKHQKTGVPHVSNTQVAAKEGYLPLGDVVLMLFDQGYSSLFLRKARGTAGEANIKIEKISDGHYMINNLHLFGEKAVHAHLEDTWNAGNDNGVLVAPYYGHTKPLTGLVDVTEYGVDVVYLGEEVTEDNKFSGYRAQKGDKVVDFFRSEAESALKNYGTLKKSQGFIGTLQLDMLAILSDPYLHIQGHKPQVNRVVVTESNGGRDTAVKKYNQFLADKSSLRWEESIKQQYQRKTLPDFAAFDHLEVHESMKTVEEVQKVLAHFEKETLILIPPYERSGRKEIGLLIKKPQEMTDTSLIEIEQEVKDLLLGKMVHV